MFVNRDGLVHCDKGGRIVLPRAIRRDMPASAEGWFTIRVVDGQVVLTPVVGFLTATPPA